MSRHIDALIAEHVFGEFVDKDFPIHGGPFCKNYSTSIADAWLVVEKMREKNYFFSTFNKTKRWLANFTDNPGFNEYRYEAESAPMAISLAALKALGVEVKLEILEEIE